MAEPRPPCFLRGGYDPAQAAAYVQFSDASIYRYDAVESHVWQAWSIAYPRGTWFNFTIRQGSFHFHRLPVYPTGLSDEF